MIISVNKDFVGLGVQTQAGYCITITSESVKRDVFQVKFGLIPLLSCVFKQ